VCFFLSQPLWLLYSNKCVDLINSGGLLRRREIITRSLLVYIYIYIYIYNGIVCCRWMREKIYLHSTSTTSTLGEIPPRLTVATSMRKKFVFVRPARLPASKDAWWRRKANTARWHSASVRDLLVPLHEASHRWASNQLPQPQSDSSR